MNYQAKVLALDPYSDARKWIDTIPPERSPEDSYAACERGDWLIWLAARAGVDRRLVTLATCDCARTGLVHIPEGEDRPRRAIDVAEAWARGKATLDEVRRVEVDAYAAYDTFARAACADAHIRIAGVTAAYAAYAAAYSATAYVPATIAAAAAAARATVIAAAVDAADAYDDADADTRALAEIARLVRARIPWDAVAEALYGKHGEV